MLDESMEELREFVNSYRLNKNHETNTRNERAECFSDDELIKLLESDTLNWEEQHEDAQCRTVKSMENNIQGQDCFNVWNAVKIHDGEGLTLEIRESLRSKLTSALSINYETTYSKQGSIFLTRSNICDIAKDIEYSILSKAKSLNFYKLSGADAVVNIEKQTCNRSLCEFLFDQIELLRRNEMEATANKNPQQLPSDLSAESESSSFKEFQNNQSNTEPIPADTINNESVKLLDSWNAVVSESEYFNKMQTAASENPQQLPNDLSTESESSLFKKSQDNQFNTEPMAVDTINNKYVKLLDSGHAVVSESEYFSCRSSDCNSDETQQISDVCTINSNTQNPVINVSGETMLVDVKVATDGELRSISTSDSVSVYNNNNYIEAIPTEPGNILSEMNNSSNGKDEFDIVITHAISQNDKRKRTFEYDLELLTTFLPMHQNEGNVDNLNKKQKHTKSETTLEISDTPTGANNNVEDSKSHLKDCLQLALDKNTKNKNADNTVVKKPPQLENIKIEQLEIKNEPISPHPTDSLCIQHKKKQILLENDSANEAIQTECENLGSYDKIDSSEEKSSLQHRINKFEFTSSENTLKIEHKTACRIKAKFDLSQYSISIDNKENIDEDFWDSITVKNENISLADQVLSDSLKDNTMLQNSEHNFDNGSASPLSTSTHSIKSAEVIATEESSVSDVDANIDYHERNIAKENGAVSSHETSTYSKMSIEVIATEEISVPDVDASIDYHESNNAEESDAVSSLETSARSKMSTEVITTEDGRAPDVDANVDCHKTNVEKSHCLIDEEAFELERARLDKLYEEMKKCTKEDNVDVIHGDYKKIFKIIIPIIREYYPSEFIPDETCYAHILQRLQIDLTHADMCDDDMAFYIKDSIKTRRYLLDHCILQ